MAQPDLKAIPLPEPDDSDRGAWGRAEILKALHNLEPGSWSAWIYLIAATTSVRLGEPVAAQVGWYDPVGFIHVRERSKTKAGKLHCLPISDRYGGQKPDVLAAANEKVCEFLTGNAEIKAAMLRLVT